MSRPSPPENRVQHPPSRDASTSRVGPLLAIILLLISLGVFYFLYVLEQQALQSRYLFHVLSKSGEDVTKTIVTRRDNIKKAFESLDPENPDTDNLNAEYSRLGLSKIIDDDEFKGLDLEVKRFVVTTTSRLLLIPGIEIDMIRFPGLQKIAGREVGVDVKMTIDSGMELITFQVYGKGQAEDGGTNLLVTIEQRLETLLRPWISVEGLLESTFVARKTETSEEVFLREGLRSLALVDIPQAEVVPEEGEPRQEEGRVAGAEIRSVEIAGERYKLFLEPFRLPIAITTSDPSDANDADASATGKDGRRETVWLIGGLVSNAAFRARTMAIPPMFVIVVFAAVVVLLLLTPYFRIRLIGKREGLNSRDVLLLVITMLLGCSLASLAVAHIWASWQEGETRKAELRQIAEKINRRLTSELDELKQALEATASDWGQQRTRGNLLEDEPWQSYPHFEMVFGIDEGGEQQWKGSVKSTTTPLIEVSDRAYFQHARDDDLWLPSGDQEDRVDGLRGRYVESIRSKTTGEKFAILSIRLPQPEESEAAVAAIESRLLSLIDPVVLPPHQFCVIDSDGTVQFHSNSRRNLTENFFESLGSNWEVKATVRQRAKRHCSATYRADPIAAYVTPLDGTPWTLVVFSDKRVLGYMHLETLTISLVIVLLYLTLLVIGGGVLMYLLGFVSKRSFSWVDRLSAAGPPHPAETSKWTRKVGRFLRQSLVRTVAVCRPVSSPPGAQRNMWYWPDPNKRHLYARVLVLILGIAAVWAAGTLTLGNRWLLPLCWFFGPIAIFVVGGMVVRSTQPRLSSAAEAEERPGKWPWTYAPAVVGVFVILAVLPPISFYAAVHKLETEAFEGRRQLGLAEQLHDRWQRHVERFRKVSLSDISAMNIRDGLKLDEDPNTDIEDAPDVHLPEGWRVEETYEAPMERDEWQQRFRDWLAVTDEYVGYRYGTTFGRIAPTPNYGEYASDTRGLITRQSERLRWPTERELIVTNWRTSLLPLGDSGVGRNADARKHIHLKVTGSRTFESLTKRCQSVAIAAVVTGAIIILLLVCPMPRWVFARDVKHPRWISGDELLRYEFPRQLRLRFPSQPCSDEESAEPLRIDFQAVTAAESGVDLVQRVERDLDSRGSESEVHLTQFDYGLTDPEIRRKKLTLLEYLVTRHNRVVIRSSIDPMFFLTEQLHDPVGAAEDIPLGRWAAALQDFATLRARKDEKELRDQLTATLQEESGTVWAQLSQEVRDVLVAEGWFNEFLRAVAKTLCHRPELREYDAEDVLEQFEDAAGAHYRRIWWSCSTDEKVLLHRLAAGGFVNWKMKDTVTSLMRRRIIVAAPDFRLMNESFRRFVLRAEPTAIIRDWEDAVERSRWKRLRAPLVVFLLLVAIFFIVTQKDVFVQLLGVLTMLTAGAPALVRLFSMAMNGREAASP